MPKTRTKRKRRRGASPPSAQPSPRLLSLAQKAAEEAALLEEARDSLRAFTKLGFPAFEEPEHVRSLLGELEAIERGENDRLMVFMPPRHGKSFLTSQRFPAWFTLRDPQRSVILGSHTDSLATDYSRVARDLTQADYSQRIWSRSLRLELDTRWGFMEKMDGLPNLVAAGVGGPLTGRGAHLLVIDDPIKNAQQAYSSNYRNLCWQWYSETARPRLERRGAIILTMTRWHWDDLAGRILADAQKTGERWRTLSCPALDEKESALWESRFPATELRRLRMTMGPSFTAQYQQRPTKAEGELFKRDWWRYFSPSEKPARFLAVAQIWDTAFEEGEENSFTVCVTLGVAEHGFFLMDVFRDRLEFPDLRRMAVVQFGIRRPNLVLIERRGSGISLCQQLLAESRIPALGLSANESKYVRALGASPYVQAGKVFLPEGAPWVVDFIEELAEFPKGEFNDQVDAFVHGILYFTRPEEGGNLYVVHEEQAQVSSELDRADEGW